MTQVLTTVCSPSSESTPSESASPEGAASYSSVAQTGSRRKIRWTILRYRLREYLTSDSTAFRWLLAWGGLFAGLGLLLCQLRYRAMRVLTAVHRADQSRTVDKVITWIVNSGRFRCQSDNLYTMHIDATTTIETNRPYLAEPEKLLGTRCLVLKSPSAGEKGVIALDYSFTFPLFAQLFDVERIGQNYRFLLEPSWSGYCDQDILCFRKFPFPVFVQAYEPRDAEFLESIEGNLVPVPTSTNWWVDHRTMRPLPESPRDADVVMIAAWAPFKRHYRLFAAMSRLRKQGRILRTVLVGYPNGLTAEEILRQAQYYDVADQIEIFERLNAEEVNQQINRAKVNLIWSRKEGVNRAIIEGMFADVPCLVRRGFNYGYAYPYINSQTGRFAAEGELTDQLVDMVDHAQQFSPREWAMDHMTCHEATRRVERVLREAANAEGERWTRGLAVKLSRLDAMEYWNLEDMGLFAEDYQFLKTMQRQHSEHRKLTQS